MRLAAMAALALTLSAASCVLDEGARGLIPDHVGVSAGRTEYDYLGVNWMPGGDQLMNSDGRADSIFVFASWDLKSYRRHRELIDAQETAAHALALLAARERAAPKIEVIVPPTERPPAQPIQAAPETRQPVPLAVKLPDAPPVWAGALMDRLVAALDRFGASLASMPSEIKVEVAGGNTAPPIVIQPPAVTVNVQDPKRRIDPPEATRDRTSPVTVRIDNTQAATQEQKGEMGQKQEQGQEQEQEQEQETSLERRGLDTLRETGDILKDWGWGTWLMLIGLIAVLTTAFVFGLRAWRRRKASKPEEDPDDQCDEKPAEDD